MDILNEIIAILKTLDADDLRIIYKLLLGFTR